MKLAAFIALATSSLAATETKKKNSTFNGVLTEAFFYKFQNQVLWPLIEDLADTPLGSSQVPIDLGFINLNVNLTDMALGKAKANEECKSLTITPDLVAFNICDLTFLNFTSNEYTVLSDPPLFTDIGDTFFAISNLNISTMFVPYEKNNALQFDFKYLDFNLGADLEAYGISDMARVITGTIHTIANVIYGRLKSSIDHQYPMVKQEVENIFNWIFTFPYTIPITDDLVITGGFIQEPKWGFGWGSLPVSYYLESKQFNYTQVMDPKEREFELPAYNQTGSYELQAFVSEFLLDSGIYIAHKYGLMDMQLDNFTDTTLWGELEPKISQKFGANQTCQWGINTIDPTPNITLREGEIGINFHFTNDLQCQMANEDGDQYHRVAILYNSLNLDFLVDIQDEITLFAYLKGMDFEIYKATDSSVGEIPVQEWTDTIYLFEDWVIKPFINELLPSDGINLEKLLTNTTIGIEKSELNLHDGYAELLLSPDFSKSKPLAKKAAKVVQSKLALTGEVLTNVLKDPRNYESEVDRLDDLTIDMINAVITSEWAHYIAEPFFRVVPKFLDLLPAQQHSI